MTDSGPRRRALARSTSLQIRMRRLFTEGISAMDIAEPLISFDAEKPAEDVRVVMEANELSVAGLRVGGLVTGYVRRADLTRGTSIEHLVVFEEDEVVAQAASLAEALERLSERRYCFVSILGSVGGIISRSDFTKPPVRMWLFGMVSILEMSLVLRIDASFEGDSWIKNVSAGRLEKAEALRRERLRRGEHVRLLDCLQLADKAQILIKEPELREEMGFRSQREGMKRVRDFESLRNNLAHAQDIVTSNWDMIVALSRELDEVLSRI